MTTDADNPFAAPASDDAAAAPLAESLVGRPLPDGPRVRVEPLDDEGMMRRGPAFWLFYLGLVALQVAHAAMVLFPLFAVAAVTIDLLGLHGGRFMPRDPNLWFAFWVAVAVGCVLLPRVARLLPGPVAYALPRWYWLPLLRARIRRRPRRLVDADDPEAAPVFVIPREHWFRRRWEPATDFGLLKIDRAARELRYEGGGERWTIPADAMSLDRDLPGFRDYLRRQKRQAVWPKHEAVGTRAIMLLFARGPDGAVWERPLAPAPDRLCTTLRGRRKMLADLRRAVGLAGHDPPDRRRTSSPRPTAAP